MSRRLAAVAIAALAAASALQAPTALGAAAPGPQPSPVAVVVDTSGSMNEGDGSASGRIKINGAKVALLDFLQQVEPGTPLGLRVYPGAEAESEEGEECSPGEARVPIQPREPATMAATIRTLSAEGNTPTAAALKAAAAELARSGAQQATIVLVSDGESNCGQDPCDAAADIAASGIDLQTITVGFRISGAGAKELQCIADQTGGKYLSVHDNEGLAEAFDEISRPRLHLRVDYPQRVTAQVGNHPSGLVRIEAAVSNPSQHQARGVVARIRFDVAAGAPATIRPVVHLGNLEPGDSRDVAWVFRPGVPPADRNPMPLPFSVIAGAQNTLSDAEFDATIEVEDAYADAGEAGPILADRRRIAILGDSYSAGEGADVYLSGTDTDDNPCHRSAHTYLAEAFDLPGRRILACSGAVTNDVFAPQEDRTVEPQLVQLRELRDREAVDAVVLTMGGNDAGFAKIVKSCLFGRADCSRTIVPGAPLQQLHTEPIEDYVRPRLERLAQSLDSVYTEINAAVNGPYANSGGDRPVPILTLAYPLPTPLTPQACSAMLDLLSPAEIEYLVGLATELNGTVEKAAERARDSGAPVFYVPNTEMAFQPDHTVCDREPWARPLKSFNGAGVDYRSLVEAVKGTTWKVGPFAIGNPVAQFQAQLRIGKAGLGQVMRGISELVHPTRAGYAAETRAVLRWSQSPDAMAAVDFLDGIPTPASSSLKIESSPRDLGQLAPAAVPTLQGGTIYPLHVTGFAPGSAIEIGVESTFRTLGDATSDAQGALNARVGIPPDLEPGDHTLVVAGIAPDGEPHVVEVDFRIAGGGPPLGRTVLVGLGIAGVLVTALLALFLFVDSRRRSPGDEPR